jgi:hypothetical protein
VTGRRDGRLTIQPARQARPGAPRDPGSGREPALSPLAEPTRKVGKRWIALIALANLGLSFGYLGPLGVLLPDQVQAIAGSAHKVAALGWVTGIGAAVAMISNPVAGALSDRTTGRIGGERLAGGDVQAEPSGVLTLPGSGHLLDPSQATWSGSSSGRRPNAPVTVSRQGLARRAGSGPGRHLTRRSRLGVLGLHRACLRAGLRETVSAGHGFSRA